MPSAAFKARKEKILQHLNVPDAEYNDLSPKGSVDEGILDLIGNINNIDGLVTTSSCAGRVSVYLDGANNTTNPSEPQRIEFEAIPTSSASGGKGGGEWLYVSHDPVQVSTTYSASENYLQRLFGLTPSIDGYGAQFRRKRLIHFKFEAMILHIATASLDDAQKVLSAALSAGFRESGAVSLTPNADGTISPMVAVRSTGLALDSLIGFHIHESLNVATVDEIYLRNLVDIANERFTINTQRIERFRTALLRIYQTVPPGWEDPEERRRRKREEGLKRQALVKGKQEVDGAEDANIDQNPVAGVLP